MVPPSPQPVGVSGRLLRRLPGALRSEPSSAPCCRSAGALPLSTIPGHGTVGTDQFPEGRQQGRGWWRWRAQTGPSRSASDSRRFGGLPGRSFSAAYQTSRGRGGQQAAAAVRCPVRQGIQRTVAAPAAPSSGNRSGLAHQPAAMHPLLEGLGAGQFGLGVAAQPAGQMYLPAAGRAARSPSRTPRCPVSSNSQTKPPDSCSGATAPGSPAAILPPARAVCRGSCWEQGQLEAALRCGHHRRTRRRAHQAGLISRVVGFSPKPVRSESSGAPWRDHPLVEWRTAWIVPRISARKP